MKLIEISKFLDEIPNAVWDITEILKSNNYKSYLVGGSVRDILIGLKPKDFDISTDAIPDTLIDLFPKSIEVGAKFGTVIVLSSPNGLNDNELEQEEYQITTFRKDIEYINGRWPSKVEFSKTIEEDLSRRDFTINAIAIDLIKILKLKDNKNVNEYTLNDFLIDPFAGLSDINNNIIKSVGNPIDRLKEDNLRAMRGCRLACSLDFKIDDDTFASIKAVSNEIHQISKERIRDEFLKILNSKKPSIGIELLRRSGLLDQFIPELLEGVGMEQNKYHTYDLYTHLIRTCDIAERDIRLAALFHDIGKSRTKNGEHFYGHEEVGAIMAENIMKRLKFSNNEIKHIVKLIRLHMFNYSENWSDSAVRRFIKKVGDNKTLKDLFALRIADSVSNPKSEYNAEELKEIERRIIKINQEDNALNYKDLKINGVDIINLGVSSGPNIGKILEYLLEKVIDQPDLNEKYKLIEISKKFIKKNNII